MYPRLSPDVRCAFDVALVFSEYRTARRRLNAYASTGRNSSCLLSACRISTDTKRHGAYVPATTEGRSWRSPDTARMRTADAPKKPALTATSPNLSDFPSYRTFSQASPSDGKMGACPLLLKSASVRRREKRLNGHGVPGASRRQHPCPMPGALTQWRPESSCS